MDSIIHIFIYNKYTNIATQTTQTTTQTTETTETTAETVTSTLHIQQPNKQLLRYTYASNKIIKKSLNII